MCRSQGRVTNEPEMSLECALKVTSVGSELPLAEAADPAMLSSLVDFLHSFRICGGLCQ